MTNKGRNISKKKKKNLVIFRNILFLVFLFSFPKSFSFFSIRLASVFTSYSTIPPCLSLLARCSVSSTEFPANCENLKSLIFSLSFSRNDVSPRPTVPTRSHSSMANFFPPTRWNFPREIKKRTRRRRSPSSRSPPSFPRPFSARAHS